MKLPNRDRAVVEPAKLTDYLLNVEHSRGGAKAQLLLQFGYSADNWQQLEADIRCYHLEADVDRTQETPYGTRHTIRASLETPVGRSLSVRTVWQIDRGQDLPRLITLIPD